MAAYITETALSVAGLTEYLQLLLEEDAQLQQVWVTGEVSSVNDHAKGLFFTLCDSDAAIQCVVWNALRPKLIHFPQRGEQILILGSIRLYAKRGDYKLSVFQILSTGEGLQALRYQQLRSRLQSEGLFDPSRKRLLPVHPQTIAVVTSPTAAAWGDIQRTLGERYPGLHVIFSPAIVQGDDAPESIASAIERVNLDKRAEVLILTRGGGAVEDLSCFNDERVIRAIAISHIPIITGIGHQRDESLADLVADYNAHTPTAAAEIAVPAYTQLVIEHQQRFNTLIAVLQRRLTEELDVLAGLKSRLKRLPLTSRQLLQSTAQCHLLKEKLLALDPQSIINRGFAVVRQSDGQIVLTTAQLNLNQELVIQLAQGQIKVKITDLM